jgi:hypothetical protein
MVWRELVIASRDPTTPLDLIEEPFDQISRAAKMRAEAGELSAAWDADRSAATTRGPKASAALSAYKTETRIAKVDLAGPASHDRFSSSRTSVPPRPAAAQWNT